MSFELPDKAVEMVREYARRYDMSEKEAAVKLIEAGYESRQEALVDRFTPTPNQSAIIDGVVAGIEAGEKTYTMEEAEVQLEDFKKEWLKKNAS